MAEGNDGRRNVEDAERRAGVRAAELAGSLDLAELRARIDVLDREIIRLLNDRARLGVAAGRAKVAAGRSVGDPERERDVLLRVALANDGPLPQAALLDLYRRLIEAIKGLEEADRWPRRPEAGASEAGNGSPEPGAPEPGNREPADRERTHGA